MIAFANQIIAALLDFGKIWSKMQVLGNFILNLLVKSW